MNNISRIHDEDCFFSKRKLMSSTIDDMYKYIEQLEDTIFSKLKVDYLKEDISIDIDILDLSYDHSDMFDDDFMSDMEEEIYCQIDEYEIKNIFHIDELLKNKITETITTNILLSIEHMYEDGSGSGDGKDCATAAPRVVPPPPLHAPSRFLVVDNIAHARDRLTVV
jgi:uncharacterized membrane protein YheB (UPF0754 family)